MTTDYVHALPPIDYPGRLASGAGPGPRCGATTGRTALFAEDVTCPDCLALMEATALRVSLRTAIERAQNTVGSAVLDLSVWEGRGDWSALPTDQRDAAAVRGLAHLDEAIAALEAQREALRDALGVDDDQTDTEA